MVNDSTFRLSDAAQLAKCEPIYRDFPGLESMTHHAKKLVATAFKSKGLCKSHRDLTGAKLKIVSVGPTREETIIL